MSDIRECPFCGNDVCIAAPISTFMTIRVICPACDCGGPECFGWAEAVEAWNRRATDRLHDNNASVNEHEVRYTVTPAGKAALTRKPADLEFSGSPQTLEEMRSDLDKAALRGES